MSGIIERVESVSYSPVPSGIDRATWAVTVQPTDDDGHYAIRNGSRCYNRSGEWDYEPLSSNRTDEWLAQHRFSHDEAVELARRICMDVTWNGLTAAEVALRHKLRSRVGSR